MVILIAMVIILSKDVFIFADIGCKYDKQPDLWLIAAVIHMISWVSMIIVFPMSKFDDCGCCGCGTFAQYYVIICFLLTYLGFAAWAGYGFYLLSPLSESEWSDSCEAEILTASLLQLVEIIMMSQIFYIFLRWMIKTWCTCKLCCLFGMSAILSLCFVVGAYL